MNKKGFAFNYNLCQFARIPLLFLVFLLLQIKVNAQACATPYVAFSAVTGCNTGYYSNGCVVSSGGRNYTAINGPHFNIAPPNASYWTDNGVCGAGSAPTVSTTDAASSITQTTATSGGNVTSDGGQAVTARGIVYHTAAAPTLANSVVTVAGTTGAFVANLSGLSASTTYYVRAYATNSLGTTYGPQISFTTSAPVAPTVTTTAASSISCSSFNSGGNVTSDGGATVTARGIVYSTSVNPTLANSVVTTGSGTGSYASAGTGLASSTTYYCKAYATNSVGTSYGAQITFTTSGAPCVPVLSTTAAASAITTTTASTGGTITSDGGSAVTARGVCYGTSSMPTISNSITSNGAGTGAFVSALSGLTESTTYYVRAYATNANGTGYGPEISFTTTALTKYYSCATANTWSLLTDCSVASAAPGNTDHAVVRHDWFDFTNAGTYNLANLAWGQYDVGNWFSAKPLKLTVQSGGRVVFTTSSYTSLPAGFALYTESGGIFSSYTSFATIQTVQNNGAMHFFGAVTNGNNITGGGQICYSGNFENSTLGGSLNGQFVSANEATLVSNFFTTNDATLGGRCGSLSTLLPVELLDFAAVKNGDLVYVTWETASEINNEYFEVQASKDGISWETIGVLKGAGTSNETHHYSLIDSDNEGYTIKYYRLKQVDFDGAFKYSVNKIVRFDSSTDVIDAFDNGNSITIILNSKGDFEISLYDVDGKLVYSDFVNSSNHSSSFFVSKENLAPGVYLIKATSKASSIAKKLFIK